jgi:hypothetical protein
MQNKVSISYGSPLVVGVLYPGIVCILAISYFMAFSHFESVLGWIGFFAVVITSVIVVEGTVGLKAVVVNDGRLQIHGLLGVEVVAISQVRSIHRRMWLRNSPVVLVYRGNSDRLCSVRFLPRIELQRICRLLDCRA